MPRGDATGPQGMGPMTGRGAGYCAGFNAPGYMNNIPGRGLRTGFGRGMGGRSMRGGGFGFRNRFFATGFPGRAWFSAYTEPYQNANPETEKEFLRDQATALENELKAIKARISELESEKAKK
ncbi:MAG TPA: DUF5320 domain-containing protein [Smithellaceae bacterium]|nr:DUF5320 domain-containing protein [Smithellaceae bacterium]